MPAPQLIHPVLTGSYNPQYGQTTLAYGNIDQHGVTMLDLDLVRPDLISILSTLRVRVDDDTRLILTHQ